MTDVDFEASIESITDELYREGITDGLPVIPATTERINEMLRGTNEPPDAELAVFGDEALTVEQLAAYGVLAGCHPPHMPVLIAGMRAMSDPASNIASAAVDPGSWAYQWIVNGPIRKRLDIRSDTGTFGPSFRVNRSIGRALGLALKNSVRVDQDGWGVQGSPFEYSIFGGENEEASPWEPHHVSLGYDENQSTITFAPRRSFIQFIPFEMDADGILEAMQANTTTDMVGRSLADHDEMVVHTIAPYNAEELGDAGLSKQDIKQFLCDNSTKTYGDFSDRVDPEYARAGWSGKVDPIQVPQIADPELIQVYVIGGSGRFNGLGRTIGGPVTVEIETPSGWQDLVDEYYVERDWGEIAKTYDEIRR